MKAYVIQRTDIKSNMFTVTHNTLDEAKAEAVRLVTKHVDDSPTFMIYELSPMMCVTADINIVFSEVPAPRIVVCGGGE